MTIRPQEYRAITRANVDQMPQWRLLDQDLQEAIQTVSAVLPFRTNPYVMDQLIDWNRVPDDPLYQLTFVHQGMLEPADFRHMRQLIRTQARPQQIKACATDIRNRLNPHPAGQQSHNVPELDGRLLDGLQHKYQQTVLVFPAAGQTCHAYCSFCFRWAQFIGDADLRFATRQADDLVAYLKRHPEVTDILITGGDPLVMRTRILARYIEPLLHDPELEHIRNIRIGTKALSYWPFRVLTDPDADDLMRLFETVHASGKQLALMAHYNHPQELRTDVARQALRRVRATGTTIRMQSPVLRHINDDAAAWAELWTTGVNLGAIPYYMFVERDTGAKRYFELPLTRAWDIFREAYQQISGLARSVRGPSMSAFPGKVLIDGVAEIKGEKVFCLQFLQARNPDWVRQPFFAKFDPGATWLHDLVPAFDSDRFFYEDELLALLS
jgi:KamA family protein